MLETTKDIIILLYEYCLLSIIYFGYREEFKTSNGLYENLLPICLYFILYKIITIGLMVITSLPYI